MDAPWLFVLGCIVLAATVIDQLATILSSGSGGGFAVPRLYATIWRLLGPARRSGGRARWVPLVGPGLLLLGPVLWIASMWLGWSLVFLADEGAVVASTDGTPADAPYRIYFAGFGVFTLGVGDVVPGGGPWALATVLAAAMGLGMVTLGITYLVPVIQAATSARRTARTLARANGLLVGDEAERTAGVDLLWNAIDDLDEVAEQHRTYHVLRYFRPRPGNAALTDEVAEGLDRTRGAGTESEPEHALTVRDTLIDLGRAITGASGPVAQVTRALREG